MVYACNSNITLEVLIFQQTTQMNIHEMAPLCQAYKAKV